MLFKQFSAAVGMFVLLLWVVTAGTPVVEAQESRGLILGTITDTTGAVIVGAHVVIVNTASSQRLEAVTNGAGEYTINYVQPGAYTATVTAPLFSAAHTETLTLEIGQRLRLNLALKPGAESERVEVSASNPLLQTSDANIGQVIDQQKISQLPLVNGSPYELVFVTPGFSPGATTSLTSQNLQPDVLQAVTTDIAAGGTPHGSTEWTIDGVPNTTTSLANYGTGASISPPTDAVQEFRAEINYDASFGHTSSYIVNSVLKAGGNQFHGSGYIYGRTPSLDANLWFNNHRPAGQHLPVPDFTYRRYGGSFTGPIRIPKIYDGRKRTFFAYSFEHFSVQSNASGSSAITVPTAKEQKGDFTERLALSPNPPGPSNPYTIYDPATIRVVNGVYTIQPMQCNGQYNVMCPSRVSKVGQALINFYPQPNTSGANNGTESNYQVAIPSPDLYSVQMLRFDQVVTEQQRFYLRFAFGHRFQGPYRNFWSNPSVGNTYAGDPRQAVMDYTWAIGQHLVADFRYGYTHTPGGHIPLNRGTDMTSLGFSKSVASQLSLNGEGGIPYVRTGLGNPFGAEMGQEVADYRNNDIHTFIASIVRDFNRHTIKMGLDARAYRLNSGALGYSAGYFNFGGMYTGANTVNGALPAGSAIGSSLASLLLGIPQAGYIDRNSSEAVQSTYWAPYIHDTWRATSKLTFDLGLRFEYYGPVTERYNRAVAGFDPNANLAITSAAVAAYASNPDPSLPTSQFHPTGGLKFAGEDADRRGFWQKPLGAFAPRFGYAYAASNIVFRGGFGVFPISNAQDGQASSAYNGGPAFQYGFSNQTQFVPTLDNGLSFIATLDNPFPNGVALASTTASQGVNTFVGNSIAFYQPNLKTPYAMQWHQGIQVQLPSQTVLEIDYRGTTGTKLELLRNINGLPDDYLKNQPNVADIPYRNYLAAPVRNPFAGLIPGSSINGSTITRSQLLTPYPQFSGVQEWVSQGDSHYHSLVARVDRRFSNGITIQASYVWSKLEAALSYLNPADPKPDMEIAPYDRPNDFALTNIVELPFGRGHHFLSNANGLVDRVVGGWQVNTIYQNYSGVPFAFGSNFIFNGDFATVPISGRHPSVGAGLQWFNTAGFDKTNSAFLGGMLRTKPIYYSTLRTGSANTWSLGITKTAKIFESLNVEFRAQAFNVLNHPNGWPAPDTNLSSGTFGLVTSNPLNDPRIVQFGGRISF